MRLRFVVAGALALLLPAAPGAAQQVAPGGPEPASCVFNSTLPTIADKGIGYIQCDSSGRLIISNPGSGGSGSGPTQTFSDGSDAQAPTSANQQSVVRNYGYNGTSWDRLRSTSGALNSIDQNAKNTITAPGTSSGQAQGVQGVTGALPVGVVQQDGQTITLSASAAGPLTNATYTTGAILTTGYASASIQTSNPGANTVTFEGSNDQTTWTALPGSPPSNVGTSSPSSTSSGTATLVQIPITTLYFRVRIATFVSGTTTSIVTMKVTNLGSVATYSTLNSSQASPVYASESAASLATAQVSIGTSATVASAARTGRRAVTIQNLGTTAVYLGTSAVTTSNGVLLPGSVGAQVTIPTSAAVYGIVQTGSQSIAILETY